MINLTINDKTISVPEGSTILQAAKQNSIDIPHLCYLEGVHKFGSCRLCVVEVEGIKKLQASCTAEVRNGMVVHTNTPKVRKVRKNNFELLLSNHPQECPSCETNKNCELQDMGIRLGVTEARFTGKTTEAKLDISPAITRDMEKCILCRRCVTVCNEIQGVGILNAHNKGFSTVVSTAMDLPLNTVNCTYCGQCTVVCPVGAIKETDEIQDVWNALSDKTKRVVVQLAPAVSVGIGEEFDYELGTSLTGELISCLREMGFDHVVDTNVAADLVTLEQSAELLTRLKNMLANKEVRLPLITSCSPGLIKYVEHNYPYKLDYFSTCKSPETMLGALTKSLYADNMNLDSNVDSSVKQNVDHKEIYVVAVSSCTAKKFEISRPEMKNNELSNVDAVLTTRELARMIKEAGIDLRNLGKNDFDQSFGQSSGAAELFGVTGGIMEATLSTVYELATGRELPFDKLKVTSIAGFNQTRDVELKIENPLEAYKYLDGITIKVAVTSGLRGAKFLMDQIVSGESPYHFIEVMGCPGGCVNGGGQPRPVTSEILQKRLEALYRQSEAKPFRKPDDNSVIMKLSKDLRQKPNNNETQEFLHTSYTKRGEFNELLDQ